MSIPILEPGCEPRCPGCAHRLLSAEASQTQKRDWLQQKLSPWRDRLALLRAVAEAERWSYREKIRLSAAWAQDGWCFGMIVRDELIPIPRCPVHSERVRRTVELLAQRLPPAPSFPLAFYVQAGAQATLVLKTHVLPDTSWLDEEAQEELAAIGIEGLWLHLHPAAGRRMFAKRGWRLLWGWPQSVDADGFVYGPTAFQQLMPALYRQALDEAEAYLEPAPGDSIVDLYCGGGASLARWTRRGARTIGVELGGEAVGCAGVNAPEALVLRGKCADRIPQVRDWLEEAPGQKNRLLYVNPPRTGLEPEVLNWVTAEFRPERMAYLSCSAGTLRRDLDVLTAADYEIVRISPYDFFPQTYHVETLVLLGRTEALSVGLAQGMYG